MTAQTRDSLIWTMAEMLVEKQVDTAIINKSLELICKTFSFDGALVYEADQAHDFNLMERHLPSDVPLCETFAINSIDPEFRSHMAKSVVTSIDKNEDNTAGERQLLNTLSATHATVFSVVDENARIFGLIVFLKTGQTRHRCLKITKESLFCLPCSAGISASGCTRTRFPLQEIHWKAFWTIQVSTFTSMIFIPTRYCG